MISLGALAVRALLRLYTYPYRKNFRSLSRTVKLKNRPYSAPRGFGFEVLNCGGVRAERIAPEGPVDGAIIQFHVGGHTAGMNTMYRRAAERLSLMCDCAVYSIDYDTGKGLVFPSVHESCFAAYSSMTAGELNGEKFVAIGDSFGANLMLSACFKARAEGIALPRALVCLCPFVDMSASGDSYRYNCYKDPLYGMPKSFSFEENESKIRRKSPYCGNTPYTDPYLSPVYGNFDGFPSMLVQYGELETSASDGIMLCKAAAEAGACVQLHGFCGMWHDFMYLFPRLKESRQAWEEIGTFIKQHIR